MEPPTSSPTNSVVLRGPGILLVLLDHIPVTVIGADRPGERVSRGTEAFPTSEEAGAAARPRPTPSSLLHAENGR